MIAERLAIGLATALLVGVGLQCGGRLSIASGVAREAGDIALYEAIVERVRAGGSYYDVAGEELHRRGYATVPFVNWRLPTLALVQAALPRGAGVPLLTLIGLLTTMLWGAVLRRGSAIRGWVALPLLLTMAPAWLNGSANLLHELWAGQLLALSLALRLLGLTWPAVAAALAAVAIREFSLGYVLVMSVWAFGHGRRSEAGLWLLPVAAGAAFLGWHALQVWPRVPTDALQNRWAAFGGWCLAANAARANPAFALMPRLLVAVAVPVAWMGLVYRAAFTPVALVVTAYMVAFMLLSRPDNWYWGLMIAPLLPLGYMLPGPLQPADSTSSGGV